MRTQKLSRDRRQPERATKDARIDEILGGKQRMHVTDCSASGEEEISDAIFLKRTQTLVFLNKPNRVNRRSMKSAHCSVRVVLSYFSAGGRWNGDLGWYTSQRNSTLCETISRPTVLFRLYHCSETAEGQWTIFNAHRLFITCDIYQTLL